jgi:tRNA threonylcarbamoyladenosine biosynthesis protein TsaE
MHKLSKNIGDTAAIAKIFLDQILKPKKTRKGALVIGLSGELGAGKTAFTQAVAKELGIKGRVSSPTFVIMKKYPIKHPTFRSLLHLDAYRLKNAEDLFNLGWRELVLDEGNIIFIEWPEKVKGAMPKGHHKIKISHTKSGQRSLKML